MSKKDENNSQIILKNNSNQNLKKYFHHKNKSFNCLTDSQTNLISMQLHSINSYKNSKDDEQKIQNSNNNCTSSHNIINNKNIPLQDINNIRVKLSKISSQFSANTPKQLANIYNQLCGSKMDPANIVVKKNLKLDIKDIRKSKNNKGDKSERNTKINNELVKYVNNDKYNFSGNFLNMTQNCSKFVLSQSNSFKNINKNNLEKGKNSPNTKSSYNSNKKNLYYTKNYINNYDNGNIESSDLTKSSSNLYSFYHSKNMQNKKVINTSKSQNELVLNNNNFPKGDKKFSEDYTDNNNKKIYFMKPIYKRKKSIHNNKSIENSNINTNQSSICSKNNNLDDNIINDFMNNNIENPEELHFFYIKILQKSKEIIKNFEKH